MTESFLKQVISRPEYTHVQLRICLFGPYQIHLGDEPVSGFASDKVRALLAFLACEADRPHRREYLAGLLWPESSERAARASLRNALANLRRVIRDRDADPPFLITTRQSVQFNCTASVVVDVRAFLAQIGQTSSTSLEMDAVMQAVALARGPFLEGFSLADSPAFEEWALLQREQLQRLLLQALDQLADTNETTPAQALPYVQRAVDLEPWVEARQRRLITLLARAGHTSEALVQYQRLERVLALELGVAPDADSVALAEGIRADLGLPSLHALAQRQLPALQTRLIGRQREMVQLEKLLVHPDVRLVTIAGPGGIGKTHLVLGAAHELQSRFADGVHFVSLAVLTKARQLFAHIAHSFNLPTSASQTPRQQLMDYLRNRHFLLVLDNFEHLLSAASELVFLLEAAPKLKILVTSRAQLMLQSENILMLEGLAISGGDENQPGADAVELFVSAASRHAPTFALSAENQVDVERICELVHGMPLAVILAAGWVQMLSPREIADQIEGESQIAIDFLATDVQGIPARQRSMRTVLDSTWAMLDDRERGIFARLGVFQGGFSPEAAQAIANATLFDLRDLHDKTCVQIANGGAVPHRYELHELLRQYTSERLAADPHNERATLRSHARFYMAYLQAMLPRLRGERQIEAVADLNREEGNFRAAWQWATTEADMTLLARGFEALCAYYAWTGRARDGLDICQQLQSVLDSKKVDADMVFQAEVSVQETIFLLETGRREQATVLRDQSLQLITELMGDNPADSRLRHSQGLLLYHSALASLYFDDIDRLESLCRQALVLFRASGHRWEETEVLQLQAHARFAVGRYLDALDLNRRVLARSQTMGDTRGMLYAMLSLGMVEIVLGHFADAKRTLDQALELGFESGERRITAGAMGELSHYYIDAGDLERGRAYAYETESRLIDLAMPMWLGLEYCGSIGYAYLHCGDYDRCVEVVHKSREMVHAPWPLAGGNLLLAECMLVENEPARAIALLDSAITIGHQIKRQDVLAKSYLVRATAYALMGDEHAARSDAARGTELAYALRHAPISALADMTNAMVAFQRGDRERAHQAYTRALSSRQMVTSRWIGDVYRRRLDDRLHRPDFDSHTIPAP